MTYETKYVTRDGETHRAEDDSEKESQEQEEAAPGKKSLFGGKGRPNSQEGEK